MPRCLLSRCDIVEQGNADANDANLYGVEKRNYSSQPDTIVKCWRAKRPAGSPIHAALRRTVVVGDLEKIPMNNLSETKLNVPRKTRGTEVIKETEEIDSSTWDEGEGREEMVLEVDVEVEVEEREVDDENVGDEAGEDVEREQKINERKFRVY
ncbi:unnamed protein product [Nippostrongylus brasiliensis]|uniref:Uncharacterized protein n=1 Tax=Nippostrongylus brasiliensis TaxID=27835 RepID=A0A0N4YMY4_NIPBR|nr:unnamed protein product [Nippostrongylus brasiliensis]